MADELSPAELAAITGKSRVVSQAAVLAKLGVPFVFLGRAIRVSRQVAQAHELLPKSRAVSGVDFSLIR
jgi:hypothetical protein